MSKILKIQNKRIKFKVGSLQQPLSEVLPVSSLFPADVLGFSQLPEASTNITTERLLDLGGSGDCFFIAVNSLMSIYTGVNGNATSYSASDIYNLLNVPQNTYIQDDHISQFIGLYPFSVVVLREYEGDCVFCQFGTQEDTVFLYNDYPRHYLVFDQVYFSGEYTAVENVRRRSKPSPAVEEKSPDLVTSFPPVLAVSAVFIDDPEKCIVEDLDLKYLYQYVDTRYQIRKQGKALASSDSRAYYKLRHNLFKTTFLNFLGLSSTEELPLSSYGIESRRTPDLVLTSSNDMIIVEFTVVKKFITSLRTKQSRNKYGTELSELVAKGWNVSQVYPTLSLDEGVASIVLDLNEVAKFLDKEIYDDPEPTFTSLQSEINSLEYNISELIPELLLNQEEYDGIKVEKTVLEAPMPFPTIVHKVGIKRQRDQNTFLLIRKNSRALERQLKLTRYNAKFVIIINRTYNKIYVDVDSSGVQKNTLLSLLQNNSPECVKYVQYVGQNVDTEEPFQAYGSVEFTPSKSRQQMETVTVDTSMFEPYYRSKLIKAELNKEMSTLADNVLSEQVKLVEGRYNAKLSKLRSINDKTIYNKKWFLFPILTDASPGDYSKIGVQTGLPLTDRLLRSCSPAKVEKVIDRNTDINKLDENLKIVNDKYNAFLEFLGHDRGLATKLKNNYKQLDAQSRFRSSGLDPELGWSLLSSYHQAKAEMVKKVGEPTRKAYRNRISLTKSYLKTNWVAEMEHFNQARGKIKMCEDVPLDDLESKVQQLISALWQEETHETTDDIYTNTVPLGKGLVKILGEMKSMGESVVSPLRKTRIMHDLQLISRLAYSLLYYSNIKSNKEDFFFDNLGFTNAIVFVKGGKKILSNKRSRLFKFIFPVKEGYSWLYNSPNTQLIKSGETLYCVWPWQTWTFSMLKKATELYYSFPNYFASSQLESGIEIEDYKKFVTTKVLNMYSQRRKVEVWFGFFRYLYLNSMSTHTSVLDLIEDMVDYEYDPYFSYCQKKFSSCYKKIYEHASDTRIFDMVTGVVIDNFDLCAEKFDESLFMTMAPFDRVNEHLNNLRSVLTTHFEVTSKFSSDPLELLRETSVDVFDDNYFQKLASDDLMFDPKLSYAVGVFAGDSLAKVTTLTDMSSEFNKIIMRTFTDVSTSKGMRDSRGQFWGKKGHEVIFESAGVAEMVTSFVRSLPQTHSEYKKTTAEHQSSFKDKIEALSKMSLEFDMKDKGQWKGSREIYVMSDTTKLLQSPLEKFFKYLCSWTPNELIHKKSHVRPKFIHSQVFEFETGEDVNTYATLDCRKWAPKSNLWKYYYFVKGMSGNLPKEFVEYFEVVWALMFTKKVRIQSFYVEKLRRNSNTQHLCDLLTERDDGDFEFVMNYSFMMGIFNYLSSLLHAFSQLYFDAKIARSFGAHFNLLAHSDDSGGVIFSKSEETNLKLFRMYEMYQKGLNHLMSKKKCSLSRKFFEMISIMYANKRLIPMTHKFLANVSFEPKGKGWVDDIATIVSKVVEIFSNGGTMLQCYLTMLTMSEMIRKFYHIPRLRNLSQIPLTYGGLFNMHPIHLILLGADAQEVLLDVVETSGERGFRVSVGQSLFGEYFPGKGVNANYHIPYYKKHRYTSLLTPEEMQILKLFSSVSTDTTLGQASGHYSRLKDPAYIYSLSGVDMCQIFTMTLFTKTIILNAEGNKRCDLRRLTTKYTVLKSLGLFSQKAVKGFSNYHHYAKASEGIKLSLSDINVSSTKTCKPLVYNTFQNLGLGLNFKTVSEIITYKKSPELHFLFPDKQRMEILVSWVKSNLQYSDEYVLEDYLMKVSRKDLEKTRSSYCFIPSGVGVDTVERFWTYINFYCTRRYFISSKKPQYFTIDQFKLWNTSYESVKHLYLLIKVALRCPLKKDIFDLLKKNGECPSCNYTQAISNTMDEIFELRSAGDSSYVITDLPFAIYTSPQARAVNVWYGKAEFILYTKYGMVEVTKKHGQTYHSYVVVSEELLDQVHFLLINFLTTRGLPELDTVYSINDSSAFKLGFSDLKQPRLVYPGERAMVQMNSFVKVGEVQRPKLYKESSRFTLDGCPVDFEIYQNYDINEGFYNDHNLKSVQNLIFEEERVVSNDDLRRSALASKAYEVLQLDPTHAQPGSIESKYQPAYLLGSERSLTRALVEADRHGLTSYRSTATPAVLDMGVLEGLTHRDIPILDLVDGFSMSRLTYKERKVFDKIVNDGSIEANQEHILDNIIRKLGAKPTMNALTVTRATFSELVYRDVKNLTEEVANDYLTTMIKSAILCLDKKLESKPEYFIQGNAAQVYQQLALMVEMDSSSEQAGELLTKLFMRAQKSFPGKFWEYRKDNLYAALIVPKEETFKNHCLFNQAILNKIGKKKYDGLKNLRQIHLALKQVRRNFSPLVKKVFQKRKEGSEYLVGKLRVNNLKKRNYFFDEDDENLEDSMDCLQGGDDPDEGLEREWDEDSEEIKAHIFNDADYRIVGENTLLNDFSKVTIKSLVLIDPYPWLGGCDTEIVMDNGVPFYKTSYPGNITKVPTVSAMKEVQISRREAKPLPKEEVEEIKRWSGRVKVETDIFSLKTEEEVYEYQADVLRNLGIDDPDKYSKNFFKLREVSNEEYFWSHLFSGINLNAHRQMDSIHKVSRRRSPILPGFTGNLKDDILRAELNAMFNGHAEEIVSGNQSLTLSSYRTILRGFRRLYRELNDDNAKAYILIFVSTMRDCVIAPSSDNWYSDSLMSALDSLEVSEEENISESMPPPKPVKSFKREYKIVSPYD